MNPAPNDAAPAPAPEQDAAVDFTRYLRVLLKRKWLILAVVAVGVTGTVLYTLRQTKIYQARASIVVEPQAPQVWGREVQEVVPLGTGGYWGAVEYYNTQIAIIVGRDLAEETVRHHRLHENPKLVPPEQAAGLSEEARIRMATGILWTSLSASLRPDSRIVDVRVRHPDPKLAADLANKHVQTFIDSNLQVRSRGSHEASKILSSELDLALRRLREAEDKLHRFKEEQRLLSTSLEDKLNQIAADLQRYNAAQNDARIKRIELLALKKEAEEAAKVDVLETPLFALVENVTVERIKTQYATESQALLKLSHQLGPKHPDYIAQKRVVDALRSALEREARLALREIEQRLAKVTAAERQYAGEVARLTDEAIGLGEHTQKYNELKRQADAEASNYALVLGRLKTSELSGRNQLGNIVWHERARAPAVHVYPHMKKNVLLALLLSLALGLSLALLLEYLDRSVKSAEDVEQAIQAPVLGMIPLLPEVAEGASPEQVRLRDLYLFRHPTSQAAECCRAIRTNILFSGADRELRVLTVTSPNPREGKTTSVIYLGTTMAQSGQRVLLVDTDMRRPRLHQSMGTTRDRGLSNLILGDTSIEDAVKTTDVPNLFLLPCGPTPPNPAELLLTQRFQQILADLRDRYDRVILDSPPLQAVADAAVLGRLSDGVILIAKSRQTNRDALIRSSRQLAGVQAPIVGVVINSLDLTSEAYGYSKYGYGYTYGETPNAANAANAEV